jgi:hypothetical protein
VQHGQAVLVGALVAVAARALLPGGWVRAERSAATCLAGALAGMVADEYAGGGWWLGAVVRLGWLVHLAGDGCTEQGVPAWWRLVRGAAVADGRTVAAVADPHRHTR